VTRFQRLVLATAVATYILVVIGGTVRVTNSGLSCVDWPQCNGSYIPEMDGHVLAEYLHRLFAILVSFLVIATAIVAWRAHRRDTEIVTLSTAAVGVLIAQIVLGGLTVTHRLSAPIVTSHLGTAMLLLGTVTLLTVTVYSRTRQLVTPAPLGFTGARPFRIAAVVAAAGIYVLLISGAYVASSNAGTSCSTWPLCNGQLFPHGSRYVEIHFMHRLLVAAFTIAFAVLVFGARRWLHDNAPLKRAVRDAFGLYLAQILLGAFNVWTKLLTPVRVLHLATGAALWVALLTIAWMANAAARPVPRVVAGRLEQRTHVGERERQEVAG